MVAVGHVEVCYVVVAGRWGRGEGVAMRRRAAMLQATSYICPDEGVIRNTAGACRVPACVTNVTQQRVALNKLERAECRRRTCHRCGIAVVNEMRPV